MPLLSSTTLFDTVGKVSELKQGGGHFQGTSVCLFRRVPVRCIFIPLSSAHRTWFPCSSHSHTPHWWVCWLSDHSRSPLQLQPSSCRAPAVPSRPCHICAAPSYQPRRPYFVCSGSVEGLIGGPVHFLGLNIFFFFKTGLHVLLFSKKEAPLAFCLASFIGHPWCR